MTNKGRAENFDAILFHSFYSSHLVGDHMVQLKVTHDQWLLYFFWYFAQAFVSVWSECHLYVKWNTWTSFVFYINVKGSQPKEAAEGPDVCFCIKRITGTRQAPGMEKVSQCTVMFYNFCWLQYFEFLIIRKLIVNLRHTSYLSQTPQTCLCKNFPDWVEKNAYIWLFQRHF